MKQNITLIDLNNFSYYPTLSIGYLVAFLRKADFTVSLLSPLNQGVGARKRERIENITHYWKARILTSDRRLVKLFIQVARKIPSLYNFLLRKNSVYKLIHKEIKADCDLVLISTYFENYYTCRKLASYCKGLNIPVIIGGPGFNNKTVSREWITLEGVDAVVGSEVDNFLPDLVSDFLKNKSINHYPGIFTKTSPNPDTSHIFSEVNQLPLPDFSDFPWDKYPMKIIPYMTGRGCGWGKCNFCSDVLYVNGRTYRSMSIEKVLDDLKNLSKIHNTGLFYFSDIKLNSDLTVWHGLIDNFSTYVTNPKWFATVHVDNKKENGLDRQTLLKARESGLMRISFGFETASQKLLNHMRKGTRVEKIKRFLHNAYEARISVRATMFVGYPYEDEEDLRLTYEFLKENHHCFDRIGLAKFTLFEMAPIYNQVMNDFAENKITKTKYNHSLHILVNRGDKYNHYKKKILQEVHKINSRPLRYGAIAYDGIM